MISDDSYFDVSSMKNDYQIGKLRNKEAAIFIEKVISNNNILKNDEIIFIGILVVKYPNAIQIEFDSYLLFLLKNFKDDINDIYEGILWKSSINMREYDKIDLLFYSSHINIDLFFTTLNFIKKKASDLYDEDLIDVCEDLRILKNLENYEQVIINLRNEFHTIEDKSAKFLLLSIYFFSLRYYSISQIDLDNLIEDILLIEIFEDNLFWNLFNKIIRYCEPIFNEKLLNFLFSRCHIYLSKDLNIEEFDFFYPIDLILKKATTKVNIHYIYKIYIDKILFNDELIRVQFRDYSIDEINLNFYKDLFMDKNDNSTFILDTYNISEPLYNNFFKMVIHNKEYLDFRDLNILFQTNESYHDEDTYLEKIRKIWIIEFFYISGDLKLTTTYIFKFLSDIKDEPYKDDYYEEYLIYLKEVFSLINDKHLNTKLFYYLLKSTPYITEYRIKFQFYIILISVLRNLKSNRYLLKFKKLIKIDYIPEILKLEIIHYYQDIFIDKDNNVDDFYFFIYSLVWRTEIEDKTNAFNDIINTKKILTSFWRKRSAYFTDLKIKNYE